MVDVGTMIQRLALLEQYVDELRRYQPLTFKEFQADSHNYWAVERGMHLCAQVVVDIANHILAAESPLQVHDYAQAIHRLGEEGILPGKFAEQFADVAKFRNVLVHEYVRIDKHKVYAYLQNNLEDFVSFSGYINEWLDKSGLLNPDR